MADPSQWDKAADDLGINPLRGGNNPPYRLAGEIGKFRVTVQFAGFGDSFQTNFFIRLPGGDYDEYRFVVKPRSSLKVFRFRYVATGDADFDQRFDVRVRGRSADFALSFLSADRRRALVEASEVVPSLRLMCNPGLTGPLNEPPPGRSFVAASIRNRADRPSIVQTVKSMVRVAELLV